MGNKSGLIVCVIIITLLCASAIGVMAERGPDNDRYEKADNEQQQVDGAAVQPSLKENHVGLDQIPVDGPIEIDYDIKEKIDALVGTGIHKVEPDQPTPFLKKTTTFATTHTEPDDSGATYNNNVSSAEEIRWDGSTNPVVYDTSLGTNQPYVDAKWGADQENPSYGSWYSDHDFYYVYLEEQGPLVSEIDFINITLTGDYGSLHGTDRSWREMGLEMTILTGYSLINQVERNYIKSRRTWWSGQGSYAENLLDKWEDGYGSFWTSAHFSPPYSGDFYIWIKPINISRDLSGQPVRYGTGPGYTPYPSNTKVWYNISVEYALKTGNSYSVGKNPTDDLKNDDVHTPQRPWSGHKDNIPATPTPSREYNMRRINATTMSTSDLPKINYYVNEMIDYNDWFNFTGDLQYSGDTEKKDAANASITCYDNFVLGIGTTSLQFLFFSITYIEVWQHDPVRDIFWYNRTWGVGYILFVDQQGQPIDWTIPFVTITCNETSDLLYVRTWTDLIYWEAATGGLFYADSSLDVWDAWGFYNLTNISVYEDIPNTPPVLTGGKVDRLSGDSKDPYNYNVTYWDINDHPPKANGISVNIDGTLHAMSKNQNPSNPDFNDGDYTNGEDYVYAHTFDSNLKNHQSQYSFVATDITGMQATGDTGVKSGPLVHNNDRPTLVIGWDMPKVVVEDLYNTAPYLLNMSSMFTDLETPYQLTHTLSETGDGPWGSLYDSDLVRIELLNNNTMMINTKPDMNGKVSLYFNATDPEGAFRATPSPVEIKVNPDNDMPIILSLEYDGATKEVMDGKVTLKAMEGDWCNFTIMAFDIDGGTTDLYFNVEAQDTHTDIIGTDIEKTAVDAHNFTGDFGFKPLNKHVGEITANISVQDDYTKVFLLVTLQVENFPNPPILNNIVDKKIDQFKWLNFTISAKDIDMDIPDSTEDLTYSCNMSDSIPMLEKGDDWNLEAKTGKFWFHPVAQEIIGYGIEQTTYHVQFKVTDFEGESDTKTVKIKVVNEPEPPEPIENFTVTLSEDDPETPEDEGLTIQVESPDVTDPDGDEIQFEWDFGDMRPYVKGQTAEYTYSDYDLYTVTLYYSDGIFTLKHENIVVPEKPGDDDEEEEDDDDPPWNPKDPPDDRIDTDDDGLDDRWEEYYFETLEYGASDDYDEDGHDNLDEFLHETDPTDPDDPGNGSTIPWLYLILIVVAVLVIIIIIIVVIVLMKGKKDDDEEPAPAIISPEEPQPMDPQQDMAYGASMDELYPAESEPEGLEPMPEPQALPEPEEAPLELPPGPEGLMEEPEPPELGLETATPESHMDEETESLGEDNGSVCPSCAFPVRPGWFLCPECKNPLS
jgi:hypothetical protein